MIGRIDERTALLLQMMADAKEQSLEQEKRIQTLENEHHKAKGALYVIGAVSGSIGAWLSKLLGATHGG